MICCICMISVVTSLFFFISEFSLVTQPCPTLCDPMDCSMPGFPVHHQFLELAQTHVHRAGDTIQSFILCCPLLLLPSIFPSIKVISNESVLPIRWPKYWRFSFSISPSNEYSGLISINIIYYLKPFPVPATLAFPPSFKQAASQNPSSLEPRANAATV